MIDKKAKIYVAGHSGLVGSASTRILKEKGYSNLLVSDVSDFDLRRQDQVEKFMAREKPEYLYLLAAKVGGIKANMKFPAEFIYDNLMIEANLIHASFKSKVKKLLYLGSSCAYPRGCPQPMKEEYLLSGKLEPTNEAYAVAKIAGLKLCRFYNQQYRTNYICVMPTNLYGKNDNFDLESGHAIPALLRKFHQAKISNEEAVTIWGEGKARREFLYSEDLCDACIFLMDNYDAEKIVNVGSGEDISIAELVGIIREVTGFKGRVIFDSSKPEGAPKKLLDVSFVNGLGWKSKVRLKDGIKLTYEWFLAQAKQ